METVEQCPLDTSCSTTAASSCIPCLRCLQDVAENDVEDHADVCVGMPTRPSRSKDWLNAVGVPSAIVLHRLGIGEVVHKVFDFLCAGQWWENYEITCPAAKAGLLWFSHDVSKCHRTCTWSGWRSDIYDHMREHHEEVLCPDCGEGMSRAQLRSHSCFKLPEDYEVACHACGETVMKSEVVSGVHAAFCTVGAYLVMPVKRAPRVRCMGTHFSSSMDLCVQMEQLRAGKQQVEAAHAAEAEKVSQLREENKKLSNKLAVCMDTLNAHREDSQLVKENETLRTALLHEWKQFRLLEQQLVGVRLTLDTDEDRKGLLTFHCTGSEEMPKPVTPDAPQGASSNSENSGLVGGLDDVQARDDLKDVQAKYESTANSLQAAAQQLTACQLERNILRAILLWAAISFAAYAWHKPAL